MAERLVSTDGSGREFVRKGSEWVAYFPDRRWWSSSSVVRAGSSAACTASGLRPKSIYEIRDLERVRMQGRQARVITVTPKDSLRYGYRSWIDEKTALPVRTQLSTAKNEIIEEITFVSLSMPAQIDDELLKPDVDATDFRWLRRDTKDQARLPRVRFAPRNELLPPGFRLGNWQGQHAAQPGTPRSRFIVTDGLAWVSVFIEPADAPAQLSRHGHAAACGRSGPDRRLGCVSRPRSRGTGSPRSVKSRPQRSRPLPNPSVPNSASRLWLLTRPDCGLCEEFAAGLAELARGTAAASGRDRRRGPASRTCPPPWARHSGPAVGRSPRLPASTGSGRGAAADAATVGHRCRYNRPPRPPGVPFRQHPGLAPLIPAMQLIRNFSIIAHVDHGKSTLADRLIQLCGGLADREMQAQVLDSMDLERERGITIKAQSVTLHYDGAGRQALPAQPDRHARARRLLLRGVAQPRGLRGRAAGRRRGPGRRGPERRQLLHRDRAGPRGVAGHQQDRPALGGPRPGHQGDRGNHRHRRHRCGACLGQDRRERARTARGDRAARFPPPKGDPEAPLQALIIDSWFDNYVGVVSLVRVVNGTLKTGEKIRVMSTGRSHIVDKLGRFTPKSVVLPTAVGRRGGFRHRRHQGDRRRAGRRHDHRREAARPLRRCPVSSRCSRACSPACSRSIPRTTRRSAMRSPS